MSGFVFSEKPIGIERGEDVYLYGEDGTEYLDFGASYAVAAVGHCHPRVVDAVTEQVEDLLYVATGSEWDLAAELGLPEAESPDGEPAVRADGSGE